jgi:IMP dehydrogenase
MHRNQEFERFMALSPREGLTFDDVSIITQYADFLPDQADIRSRLTARISLNIPAVSAAMDTVTESGMAIAMALNGGIGIIHKNLTAEEQARQVAIVKHHLNGLIQKPVVFKATDTLESVLRTKDQKGYGFSGFPIVNDEGRVVGILTATDIKYAARKKNLTVADVMTTTVITASAGTTLKQAFEIMLKNRIGKLPLVENDKLVGLYSYHDVRTLVDNVEPQFNRDAQYRLRAGAAIGPNDRERVAILAREAVDVVVVDTAHGHSKGVIEMVKWVKANYPDIDVVAGNIATAEAALALRDAGADAVKVGIGPGSICTTRVVAGVGIPQITAVFECAKALEGSIPIIADGGIRHSGDIPKAIVAGADAVMMGSALAGSAESPGEKIIHQGRQYVVYRGMGSLAAMKDGMASRERYGQSNIADSELVPQGIEGVVPYAGSVNQVIVQYMGGLRAAMGYSGCRTIDELQRRGRVIRVSMAGLREAHPHTVKILKEAPNYRSSDSF